MTSGADTGFEQEKAQLDAAIGQALNAAENATDNKAVYDRAVTLYDVLETAGRAAARLRASAARRIKEDGGLSNTQLGQLLGIGRQRAHILTKAEDETPEPAPVAAVIIVMAKRVLITRRVDGSPPWGFVTGQVEAGENARAAAVREAREETGLEIRVTRELGRRVHPDTGRTMIYLAARPENGSEPEIGDPAELAELRWATLAEADELLPGMFANVRAYLRTALR